MRTPPLPHQAEPIRCQVRSLIEGQGHLRRTKPRKHLTSLSAISILISHKIAILGSEREGSGSSTLDVAVILSRWDPMVRFIPFSRRSTLMERRNGHASRRLPARLSSVTQSEPLTKSRAQQHSTHLKEPRPQKMEAACRAASAPLRCAGASLPSAALGNRRREEMLTIEKDGRKAVPGGQR
jgi:hypothetical protein